MQVEKVRRVRIHRVYLIEASVIYAEKVQRVRILNLAAWVFKIY